MSRIIVERHSNGEERLAAGYDRPMGYFFVDAYDRQGEYVGGIGLLGARPCESPEDAARWLREQGVADETAEQVRKLLREHKPLEFPMSNVVVDLTR